MATSMEIIRTGVDIMNESNVSLSYKKKIMKYNLINLITRYSIIPS